jgi:hypothetical protein
LNKKKKKKKKPVKIKMLGKISLRSKGILKNLPW